jgi:hypothetical protein
MKSSWAYSCVKMLYKPMRSSLQRSGILYSPEPAIIPTKSCPAHSRNKIKVIFWNRYNDLLGTSFTFQWVRGGGGGGLCSEVRRGKGEGDHSLSDKVKHERNYTFNLYSPYMPSCNEERQLYLCT